MDTKHPTSSFLILGILGLACTTLKLTGHIDWSWWWVLAPFWVGFPIVALILAAVVIILLARQHRGI